MHTLIFIFNNLAFIFLFLCVFLKRACIVVKKKQTLIPLGYQIDKTIFIIRSKQIILSVPFYPMFVYVFFPVCISL